MTFVQYSFQKPHEIMTLEIPFKELSLQLQRDEFGVNPSLASRTSCKIRGFKIYSSGYYNNRLRVVSFSPAFIPFLCPFSDLYCHILTPKVLSNFILVVFIIIFVVVSHLSGKFSNCSLY